MNDDALFDLIAQWETLADSARDQMRNTTPSNVSRVAFYEGVVKTYRSAAEDLRALLAPAEAPATQETPAYLAVQEAQAAEILQRAGLFTRSLTLHPDRVFTAVFSRLQPVTHEARVRQLTNADARIVIVDHGTLRDTGDLFIDFAFS